MTAPIAAPAFTDTDQSGGSSGEQGREVLAPAETDWLHHTLAISGPVDMVGKFRTTARGTNAAPWSLDLDAEEARLLAPMAREGRAARALVAELREVIATNHERMLARWHEPGTCLLDLHRLVPIPPSILQLGEDHARARVWLWENWGTTQTLRHVRLVEEAADGRRRRTRRDVLAFSSADWTPWQALRRIRRDWPDLIFTVDPRYQFTEAASGGEKKGA